MTTPDFATINAQVIDEYRADDGKVGGMFAGGSLVLLHHTGARSGVERVSPVARLVEDGRMVVFASEAGPAENPAWYGPGSFVRRGVHRWRES